MPARPVHHTPVVDTPWNGAAVVASAPAEEAALWYMHAWRDPEADPNTKMAYSFPHHEAGDNGAANLPAVRNALSRLAQSDIPAGDRAAVEAHLQAHLADGESGGDTNLSAQTS